MFTFKSGNIWSGDRTGLAVLTNPTELAFKKGNLRHHYPVRFLGKTYVDAEQAFQQLKGQPWVTDGWWLMVDLLTLKLDQHPHITETLTRSGGVAFLESCDHKVYGRSWWEGKGRQAPFISALIAAFKRVTKQY